MSPDARLTVMTNFGDSGPFVVYLLKSSPNEPYVLLAGASEGPVGESIQMDYSSCIHKPGNILYLDGQQTERGTFCSWRARLPVIIVKQSFRTPGSPLARD